MFDPDLIEKNKLAQQGLKFLAHSGILEEQKQALLDRLATGDPAVSESELIPQIREFRLKTNLLESLIQTAEYYKGEEQ